MNKSLAAIDRKIEAKKQENKSSITISRSANKSQNNRENRASLYTRKNSLRTTFGNSFDRPKTTTFKRVQLPSFLSKQQLEKQLLLLLNRMLVTF